VCATSRCVDMASPRAGPSFVLRSQTRDCGKGVHSVLGCAVLYWGDGRGGQWLVR